MSTQVATPLAGTTTATAARAAVPWSTVIALGVVLAYSSGFWITSLIAFIAAIPPCEGRRPSAAMMQAEKMKKRPAFSPVPTAAMRTR